MRLYPSKSQTIVVIKFRMIHPPHPPLYIGDAPISKSFKFLGVIINDKLTFEWYLHSVASFTQDWHSTEVSLNTV